LFNASLYFTRTWPLLPNDCCIRKMKMCLSIYC
jgi:hypothetical protein